MTDRLRVVSDETARVTELVRPPADALAHGALVAGEMERLRRWREALMRTFAMQLEAGEATQKALSALVDAAKETQDFVRWINERLAEHDPPNG